MPSANDRINTLQDGLLRIACYGVGGTKKTWWGMNAAKFGFNVIDIDGDDGWKIVNQIDEDARNRIGIVDVVDTFDNPVMCTFLTRLLKGEKFLWNETKKQTVFNESQFDLNDNYVYVDASKLTRNDVLCIDSWTSLRNSLGWKFAKENNIDLSDPSLDSNWDGYRWMGALADWYLQKIHALPCHVIVIGHETTYEKRDQEKNSTTRGKLISSKKQMVSTSGPHGSRMMKDFSDMLYFYIEGVLHRISTMPEKEKDAKSQLVKPGEYFWKDLQFDTFCKAANIPFPQNVAPCEGFKFMRGADVDLVAVGIKRAAVSSVVNAASSEKPKSAVLTGLLAKKG